MEAKQVTFEMMYAAMLMMTEALNANTAAILQNGGQSATQSEPEKAKRSRKSKDTEETPASSEAKVEKLDAVEHEEEAATKGVTLTDCETALLEVKGKHGSEAANKIVVDFGGAATLKKVEPENYQAIIDACEEKMKEDVKPKEPVAKDDDASDDDGETEITLADLKAKANELAKAMGSPEKAKKLIAEYGVSKTDDLDKKHYASLMKDFEAELAKHAEGDF